MGYDPNTEQLQVLNDELFKQFKEKGWPIFREGEVVLVKPNVEMGSPFKAKFRIAEISNNRMVLIAVGALKESTSVGG